ncbi:hypothetical protein E3Q19_01515 [Wallemia mellicola]|nr:hypothetical protein E3Q19_01515 [Wallemia mellicola]TIC75066.1 hypothetical protein E3Q00_01297 [Wallemia mellicola]
MELKLKLESGDTIPISDNQKIGRKLFKDYPQSKTISKNHGQIYLDRYLVMYEDLGSLHGSYIIKDGKPTKITPYEPLEIGRGVKLQLAKHLQAHGGRYKPMTFTVEAEPDFRSTSFSARFSDIMDSDDIEEVSTNKQSDNKKPLVEKVNSGELSDDSELFEPSSALNPAPGYTASDYASDSKESDNNVDSELDERLNELECIIAEHDGSLEKIDNSMRQIKVQSFKNAIIYKRLQVAKRKDAFRSAKLKSNKLKKARKTTEKMNEKMTEKMTEKRIEKPSNYNQSLTAGIIGGAIGVSLGAAATITFLLNLD